MRTIQARMFGGVAGAALLLGTTAAQAAVEITVGRVTGAPGSPVQVEVTLNSDGNEVAAMQNDIVFDPAIVSASAASACVINPAISNRAEGCEDDPTSGPCKQLNRNLGDCPGAAGCPAGSEGKKRFRAIILSLDNSNAIPDGLLYTCTFQIAAEASGTSILQNLNIGASSPAGSPLDVETDPEIVDGSVTVEAEPPTPTPTATPVPPTNTPVPPTNTPVPPTNTPVPPTATNTRAPGGDDDDGCQIVASEQSNPGWMLLFPAAALLFLRRRGR